MTATWMPPLGGDQMLMQLVDMEEERYLRTVAYYLQHAGVKTNLVKAPSLSYTGWILECLDSDGDTYDFYVSSGGIESEFKFQIVGDLNGACQTFIDLPVERPVTSAYIILDHCNNNAKKAW